MAMNGKTLGDAIANIIIAENAPADMRQKITAQWEAIGAAIVEHIQKNALVTVAAGISVATAGNQNAQTGSTTSTGTGTIA